MPVNSNMLPLGTIAPDFILLNPATGHKQHLINLKSSKVTLVMFICNHCPFVLHVSKVLGELGHEYIDKGVSIIAISSNDITTHPDDAPDKMVEFAKANNFNFPYLYDESQDVARAYHAACTPDFYLFDGNMQLVYRGQFDDSRPSNGLPVTGTYVKSAIDAVLNGTEVDQNQFPSIGCGIKWKHVIDLKV